MSNPNHRRRAAVLCACAATLAASSAALAQTQDATATVILTHDDPDGLINVGDTVTWSLHILGDYSEGPVYAAWLNADLHPTSSVVTTSDFEYKAGFNGGSRGGISDGTGFPLLSFVNGSLGNWQIPADLRNPLPVGSFETTATEPGTLDFRFEQGPLNSLYSQSGDIFLVLEASAFRWFEFPIDQVNFNIDTLTIVPSPGALALFALALPLIFARRHR